MQTDSDYKYYAVYISRYIIHSCVLHSNSFDLWKNAGISAFMEAGKKFFIYAEKQIKKNCLD